MAGFDNSVVYPIGVRLEDSTQQAIGIMQKTDSISQINIAGSPEGVAAANVGSIAFDRTGGDWYRKDTGTGNTGWVLANGALTTVTGDDGVTTSPDAGGDIELIGVAVNNATFSKPLWISQDSVDTNQENWSIQVATEIAAAPGDKNDAGICSFNDGQFTVDANGFVALVGGVTPPALTFTGNDGVPTSPDGSGDVELIGVAVNNATFASPLWISQDGVDTSQENFSIQVSTEIASAPGDKNDAGICSFDSSDFTVDNDGFVQLVGASGLFWQEVAINTNMLAQNGYVTNAAGSINLALPTSAVLGDIVRIVRKGAGGFVIVQAIGQTIHFGSSNTTTGVAGSVTSLNRWDALELVCTTANTDFTVISSQGAGFTIV